jgi:hypothetical protein
MTRLTLATILVASFGAACTDDPSNTEDPGGLPPEGSTAGSPDQTFDHDNAGIDPFSLIDRLAKEGPARFSARVHSCAKPRIKTLANVLTSLGVSIANDPNNKFAPGSLFVSGYAAMGGPNFGSRIRENLAVSTSGASREFDIFAAAAQTIIDKVPTLERCKLNGAPAQMFNGNSCDPSGVACLLGAPASLPHLDFCNLSITSASTPEIGKRIAVAALLAAAYTCE